MVAVALISGSALAADGPSLWTRGMVAAAGNPSGVVAEGAAELRKPILRFGGVAFNDTFVGVGARATVTPVHNDIALRASVQPIDLLPVTVELFHSSYWESPWGLVPARTITDQQGPDRRPLYDADRDFAGQAWGIAVNPTFQLKLGPIVGFTNATVTWFHLSSRSGPTTGEPGSAPWVHEPYRGLVVAYDDRLLEHGSAVMVQPMKGEDGPLLRFGPVVRGKGSSTTHDTTLTAGALAQWRPGSHASDPTMTLLVTPYLRDPDLAGPIPYVAFLLATTRDTPLGRTP